MKLYMHTYLKKFNLKHQVMYNWIYMCIYLGSSMRSLTLQTKEETLAGQFEYGDQHKKGNRYTRQRMCNMVSSFVL